MSQRLLTKLESCMESEDYYQAHQIYRTLFFRLKRENKFAEAYTLLSNGAIKLMLKQQINSGADLANLIIGLLTSCSSSAQIDNTDTEVIDNLCNLFRFLKPESPERSQFVSQALQIPFLPQTLLRKRLAEIYWSEKDYAAARLHYLYSSDSGSNCALMLVEYQTKLGSPHEYDLMIAQFVLQVLCCENKQLAVNTFHFYTMNHPKIGETRPPFPSPLLNFICFLLIAIDNGKSILFNTLCSLYSKSLGRDPYYTEYLETIGQLYFGIEKKKKQAGIFSNLFQSLFENNDKSEDAKANSHTVSTENEEAELD